MELPIPVRWCLFSEKSHNWIWPIDGLVQEKHNSSANALELRLSCTNQSNYVMQYSIASLGINEGPHGPLARYAKLQVAHAPGMLGTFSMPPRVSNPVMHHSMCVTHVPWCMSGSPTRGFLWNWWQGKHSRHSWHMHNPQFYVSGKRSML